MPVVPSQCCGLQRRIRDTSTRVRGFGADPTAVEPPLAANACATRLFLTCCGLICNSFALGREAIASQPPPLLQARRPAVRPGERTGGAFCPRGGRPRAFVTVGMGRSLCLGPCRQPSSRDRTPSWQVGCRRCRAVGARLPPLSVYICLPSPAATGFFRRPRCWGARTV